MEEKSVGVLLARGPDTDDARLAFDLARAALERGTAVRVFLMWDGVDHLEGDEVVGLARAGADVAVCTQTAVQRRRPLDRPGIDYASQYRLAEFVAASDRFVSIT